MRRFLPATALAAVLLGLTACGSSGGSAEPGVGNRAAAVASASPASVSADRLFDDLSVAMARAKSARTTFASSVGDKRVTGKGEFRFGKSLAADLSVVVPGQGRIRVVVLPEAFYLRLPAGSGLPGGTSWIKIGGSGNDALSRSFGPMLEQFRQSFDPGSNLALLKAATTVRRAGTQQVDGVRTTKYTATVDLAKAAAAATGPVAQQYDTLVTAGTKTLSYALWVDGQALPRRFSTAIDTAQGTVSASGTYAGWGDPVSVTAPPADQVASADQLTLPGAS